MSNKPIDLIAEWHDAINQPHFIDLDDDQATDLVRLRHTLIEEECHETLVELESAMAGRGNLVALAKELADLLYVVYGTAHVFDIPIEVVFKAVHESNMSKLDDNGQVIRRADGKVLKSPNYREPDINGAITGAWL